MAAEFLRKLQRGPLTLMEHLIGSLLQERARHIDLDNVKSEPHGLDSSLVVSLTSYPPRFRYLAPTLKCLLSQSVRPDIVVLWLSYGDKERLPQPILQLEKHGLLIRECEDFRSYNKIVPSLIEYPDSYIVTADDDTYYWPTWLEELSENIKPGSREIIFHRGHKVKLASDGTPAEYNLWAMNTDETTSSALVFPTGVGGVIYSPNLLHPDVTNVELFTELCPSADDIWLYWMGLRQGSKFRKIGRVREARSWPGTQQVALHRQNVIDSANDRQIRNLLRTYGFPAST